MRSESNFSIISNLKLPLTMGVILAHSLHLPKGQYPFFDVIYQLLSHNFGQACVPLFFFFSGYLFFANVKDFSWDVYRAKIKRRVTSLMVPYILWNLFYIAMIWMAQLVLPSLTSGEFKSISELSLMEWVSLFYCAFDTNLPVAFHLWYLRDLILVAVLMTPIIYVLSKKLSFWWLVLPLICFTVKVTVFDVFSFLPLLFFGSGCYFGIKKLDFSFGTLNLKLFWILLYIVVLIIEFPMKGSSIYPYIRNFDLVLGCIAILQLASLLFKPERTSVFSSFSNKNRRVFFYIYCYHGIFATFLASRLAAYVNSEISAIAIYLASAFGLLAFGFVTYYCLQKIALRFLQIISGETN